MTSGSDVSTVIDWGLLVQARVATATGPNRSS
jgi:hypothetical protein